MGVDTYTSMYQQSQNSAVYFSNLLNLANCFQPSIQK